MLSQFAIIKSYLDERSGKKKSSSDAEEDSFAIAICALLSAWPHVGGKRGESAKKGRKIAAQRGTNGMKEELRGD